MLCDICHKNSATVHLTEIINDKVVEMHICQICAQDKAQEINEQLSISDFLGGLLDTGERKTKEQVLKCSSCGLSYTDFKKKGRLGCGRCYVTFKQFLMPLLKRIHSAVRHIGKAPSNIERAAPAAVPRDEQLRKVLERAIKLEEYEEAAKIRDQIKELEKKENQKREK